MEGDIVSLDAGVIYNGYHSDAARTHMVGECSAEAKKLIEIVHPDMVNRKWLEYIESRKKS